MSRRSSRIRRIGLLVTLVSLVPSGCRSSGSLSDLDYYTPGPDISALDAVEAKVVRLMDAMDTASARSAGRARDAPCRAAALPATPDQCSIYQAQLETRDALRTVQHALVRDLFPLVARLQRFSRNELHHGAWLIIVDPVLGPTVEHTEWIVDALQQSHERTESADLARHDDWSWQEAARLYESALLGAQVLAVWVSWLDFNKQLYDLTYSRELIAERLSETWQDMAPVLDLLRTRQPRAIQAAALTLQSKLPEWTEALSDWSVKVEKHLREGAELTEKLVMIQTAFELLAMGKAAGSLGGGARNLVFIMPGIGGVSAGGVATGVRVVVSAEWIAAIQRLVAIGAITTVEIAKLAGISAGAMPGMPRPEMPTILQRAGESGGATGGTVPPRPQVLVQHRGGNRQIRVGGQRWHVPKGTTVDDIPASDPVGDRLQAMVDAIAPGWSPAKLRPAEQAAIDKALAAGKPWRARLLERQARGRWVERQVKRKFTGLTWSPKGVDFVDPGTGIKYEVLSGTPDNLNLHAKRMAGELFRMITF